MAFKTYIGVLGFRVYRVRLQGSELRVEGPDPLEFSEVHWHTETSMMKDDLASPQP